jgi:MerR family transcriptional regulator, copper efflux regulator
MKIGELSKRTEIGIEAIRFYEKEGLIPPPKRSEGGYREYGPDAIKRLSTIRNARNLGFSLAEIGELFSLADHPMTSADEVRQKTQRKLEMVRAKIAALQATEVALQELVDCCPGVGTVEDCPILNCLNEDTSPSICAPAPRAGLARAK